jgi:hypothetical protein
LCFFQETGSEETEWLPCSRRIQFLASLARLAPPSLLLRLFLIGIDENTVAVRIAVLFLIAFSSWAGSFA